MLAMDHTKSVSVSLTVRRLVPGGSEIFRLTQLDDVEGIKIPFNRGLASPNDSYPNGTPALVVSFSAPKYFWPRYRSVKYL